MNRELKFQTYWKDKRIISGYTLIDYEVCLQSPMSIFKKEIGNKGTRNIGRIDAVFKKGSKKYIGEIKYQLSPSDFWDATKILAYYEYYKWQLFYKEQDYKLHPCVLIPKDSIRLEHQITAGLLNIEIFAIVESGNSYTIETTDNMVSRSS